MSSLRSLAARAVEPARLVAARVRTAMDAVPPGPQVMVQPFTPGSVSGGAIVAKLGAALYAAARARANESALQKQRALQAEYTQSQIDENYARAAAARLKETHQGPTVTRYLKVPPAPGSQGPENVVAVEVSPKEAISMDEAARKDALTQRGLDLRERELGMRGRTGGAAPPRAGGGSPGSKVTIPGSAFDPKLGVTTDVTVSSNTALARDWLRYGTLRPDTLAKTRWSPNEIRSEIKDIVDVMQQTKRGDTAALNSLGARVMHLPREYRADPRIVAEYKRLKK